MNQTQSTQSKNANTPLDTLLDTVIKSSPRSLSDEQKTAFSQFLPLYFKHSQIKDLEWINPEDLNGLALSHWQCLLGHEIDQTLIRLLNPSLDTHGWQSINTVIEIVTPDEPHLVASIRSALLASGYTIKLIVHPTFNVQYSQDGKCTGIDFKSEQSVRQKVSAMHLQIEHVEDEHISEVKACIESTLATLTKVRQHTPLMQNRLAELVADKSINAEQTELLDWLNDKQFICFGIADLKPNNASDQKQTNEQALGLFADSKDVGLWDADSLLPNDAFDLLSKHSRDVVITKADQRSPIIRPDYTDLILILHKDPKGALTNITSIAGLFATAIQDETADAIPMLKNRIESLVHASQSVPDSHNAKALSVVLRRFPRDMLMQTSNDDLLVMAERIVSLHERAQIRLFHSSDPMGRFCNCLIYIPRDNYSRDIRLNIESILTSLIDGKCTQFYTEFSSESSLARLHFVIRKNAPLKRKIDWASIKKRIINAAITWDDRLLECLRKEHNEATALNLYKTYSGAFPSSYLEDYSARIAVSDIAFMEANADSKAPLMSFYRHIVGDSGAINFKIFSPVDQVTLSDVMPIIENMGLRVDAEHPFEINRKDSNTIWINEFTVEQLGQSKLDSKQSADNIQKAFSDIWNGEVENDGFNRLILEAGLNSRQVAVLRSYCKYLLQIGVPFSQTYMVDSLVANHEITADIVSLFETRFKLTQDNNTEKQADAIQNRILSALDNVDSLDEDRIIRAYLNLIQATLRTNAFRTNAEGDYASYLSYKFNSSLIQDLPLPHPMMEIFVYSPDFEGIHLRGGKVARGGLRWSDRREDFRTEVLGLMKAQMVKNAVIVPVGSKGGFYVKRALSTEREQMMEQVVGCYQNFLRGLLDITDNIVGDDIIPAENVIRYDEDDPYLVVAADKGTATFSDFANAVSAEYDFWLGDAFASGGSVGYDHKKMGITARGAWESVKRHFRELGHDTQTQPFTVVGIGDMAGDVFGNGMLLSEQIQLVAAFNHMHIFIDPTPNASSSFAERKRMFDLPRSSWTDYETKLLSKGGGIYSRSDKSIKLSSEAQKALGLSESTFTPTELISAILQAPVDLLWNGGIGTYMKSSAESHADAADRSNDALRVNASQLRCRVFGEGGNLGCTQLGRIEFARNGGMIYTDAIDNSAGVDCSDHEVNIKILVNSAVTSGDLTLKQRDNLLAKMTDEVGLLVLRDNYLQTQCINQCMEKGGTSLEEAQRFMQYLESIDRLNRSIEFLPDNEEIADRLAADEGLSRPEVAVLVSYSKMVMYDDLLASDICNESALIKPLHDYFPNILSEQFGDRIDSHRLRSEIIATIVTNELVNRLGPTFAFQMQHELGASAADIATAFIAVRSIFNLPELWESIEVLDNKASASIQNQMQILVRGLVERSTHWMLRSRRDSQTIDEMISQFQPGITELIANMQDSLATANKETLQQRIQYFVNADVPVNTATAVSQVVPLSSSLDIVEIGGSLDTSVSTAAKVYFELGNHLELHWLRENIADIQARSHWHTLSKSELRGDLHYQQRHLTAEVISSANKDLSPDEMVKRWSTANYAAVQKYSELIVEMKASTVVDFAMLSLAVNEVHKLLRSDRPLAAN